MLTHTTNAHEEGTKMTIILHDFALDYSREEYGTGAFDKYV
jgi:hypothetical protein